MSFDISIGRNKFDNAPQQFCVKDFDDLIRLISRDPPTEKGQTYLCAKMAEGEHSDPERCPGIKTWRQKKLAQPRRFLCLDIDKMATPETFEGVRSLLANTNCYIYTTASHTPEAPRARVVIELTRDVDRTDGIALGIILDNAITVAIGADSIQLDSAVYRAEQPVYVPLEGASTFRIKGEPLDVDAVLESQQNTISGHGSDPWLKSAGSKELSPLMQRLVGLPETSENVVKVKAALDVYSSDRPYSEWRDGIFALQSTGWVCSRDLAEEWSRRALHRFDQAVFDQLWARARPGGGLTIRSLLYRAQRAIESGSGQLSALATGSAPTASTGLDYPAGKLTILNEPPPKRSYVLGECVVPGTVAILAGVGGSSKTGFAIQLCIQGALSRNLGGLQVGEFASLLLLAEETTGERDRRFGGLCSQLSEQERAQVEKRVHCRAEAGNDVRLTTLNDGSVEITSWVKHIIELSNAHAEAAGIPMGLIVVDHARLIMAGDPISSEHVTALLRALTHIAVQTGSAVLLLAHSPKSTLSKDSEADAAEVFGSGAFVDHTRAAFVLHGMRPSEAKTFGLTDEDRKQYVFLRTVKANYGSSDQFWVFKKKVLPDWQVLELEPAALMPEIQGTPLRNAVGKRIVELVAKKRGQISPTALRTQYGGTKGVLKASDRTIRSELEKVLEARLLIARAPDLSRNL